MNVDKQGEYKFTGVYVQVKGDSFLSRFHSEFLVYSRTHAHWIQHVI